MTVAKSLDERQVFDELVERNFKPADRKSASRIVVEVLTQLAAVWMLTNLATYVWRICTGC